MFVVFGVLFLVGSLSLAFLILMAQGMSDSPESLGAVAFALPLLIFLISLFLFACHWSGWQPSW